MRSLLAWWSARQPQPIVPVCGQAIAAHLPPDTTGVPYTSRGPVNPQHDPCGRPPLPAEEAP